MSHPAIDYFSSQHPLRAVVSKIAYTARKKMYEHFCQEMKPTPQMTIIDVGVTPDETLPDSNFFERFYPYSEKITTTSIEDASFLEQRFPGLRFVRTDGQSLPFADKSFDIAVSFAVLEHVGDQKAQRRFISELLRVSRKVFLTTPDRSFPVEVHTFIPFLHWLPQNWHQQCLKALHLHFWADTNNLNLLYRKDLAALFPPEASISITSHRTLGLSSNLIAIASL